MCIINTCRGISIHACGVGLEVVLSETNEIALVLVRVDNLGHPAFLRL